jgi:hypothetical protein
MPTKGRPQPHRYPATQHTQALLATRILHSLHPHVLTYQPHIAVTHPTLPHAHLKGFVH